jgi:hypothetical protein
MQSGHFFFLAGSDGNAHPVNTLTLAFYNFPHIIAKLRIKLMRLEASSQSHPIRAGRKFPLFHARPPRLSGSRWRAGARQKHQASKKLLNFSPAVGGVEIPIRKLG